MRMQEEEMVVYVTTSQETDLMTRETPQTLSLEASVSGQFKVPQNSKSVLKPLKTSHLAIEDLHLSLSLCSLSFPTGPDKGLCWEIL